MTEEFKQFIIHITSSLTEGRVSGAPEYANMHLSIDNREQNHKNIPHFHIYYGSGNQHRSVGYKICGLQALDTEKDDELLKKQKDIAKYLDIIKSWQIRPSRDNPKIINLQFMLNKYKEIFE